MIWKMYLYLYLYYLVIEAKIWYTNLLKHSLLTVELQPLKQHFLCNSFTCNCSSDAWWMEIQHLNGESFTNLSREVLMGFANLLSHNTMKNLGLFIGARETHMEIQKTFKKWLGARLITVNDVVRCYRLFFLWQSITTSNINSR